MPEAATIVFVGRRAGALAAARDAGYRIVEVLPAVRKPAGEPVIGSYVLSADASAAEVAELASRIAGLHRTSAVVALTEAAVVPAARLRDTSGFSDDDTAVARRCTDKVLMKRTVSEHGIACAKHIAGDGLISRSTLIDALGLPVYLKPRIGSGSRNSRSALSPEDVPDRLGVDWLAERAISGTELSVEGLFAHNELLFCNFSEYLEPAWSSIVPASLARQTREALTRLMQSARAALGVTHGIVHMEAFLTAEGPVFGELAWRPPGGHLMELMTLAYGFDIWRALLNVECGDDAACAWHAQRFAGARIVHPGPGVVRAVHGLEAARAIRGIRRIHLRAKPGTILGPRLGTGQEAGHIVAAGATRDAVCDALTQAQALLRVELDAGESP